MEMLKLQRNNRLKRKLRAFMTYTKGQELFVVDWED